MTMTESKPMAADSIGVRERERLLGLLAVTTFIVFFQAYMVAPVIPALSNVFRTSAETVGLIIPAYLIPYGIATLAYGPLVDRIGIHRVMFASLLPSAGADAPLRLSTPTRSNLKSAPQAVTSVSCQLLGFMGKCSWQGRGSIIPSSGMNIVAVEFMARSCLDERQAERS